MSTARILLCSLALLPSLVAHAAIWGERGDPKQILVRGPLAYEADGRGVAVYDISDPTHIRSVDIESRHAETTGAAWMGNELVTATTTGIERFAISEAGGLTFVDALSTMAPVAMITAGSTWGAFASGRDVTLVEPTSEGLHPVSTMTMTAAVVALAAVDDYLYVAVDKRGTYVFEVPSMQQVTLMPYTALDFERAGTVLWGATPAGGIASFDIRNPRAPRRLGTAALETHFDELAVSGSRIYANTSTNIAVFDGSVPSTPTLIATIDGNAETIAATPDFLIASRRAAPVRIFDHTRTFLGELTDLAGPVSGIWTGGSLAYVVDPPYLRVLDVSITEQPRELRSILIPDIQDRIRVKNGLAILYGNTFVNFVDVSDPLRPRHIGTWYTQGLPPSNAAIANGRVIEANDHSGLHVVDYSDPTHAVQVGGRKFHYHDLAAGDDVIYTFQDGYFLILEIVDGHALVEHGTETVTAGQNIEIAPPNAPQPEYVVTRSPTAVRVYDVATDRFAPTLINEIPLDHPGLIATGNGVAYVELNGTLNVIDLASADGVTDTGMEVSAPMQISVGGDKIVVADRYRVRVFGPDTASPVPPTRRRAVTH